MNYNVAMINMNSPELDLEILNKTREGSRIVICDGAYEKCISHFNRKNRQVYLIGDFDSIDKQMLEKVPKDITVVLKEDQQMNDLEKALILLEEHGSVEEEYVIMNGCTGGRFDHVVAATSKLIKYSRNRHHKKGFNLIGVSTSSILLPVHPGETVISTKGESLLRGGVGIFPFEGSLSKVRTEGLKYNINESMKMMIGDFVSTSNELLHEDGDVHIFNNSTHSFIISFHRSPTAGNLENLGHLDTLKKQQ